MQRNNKFSALKAICQLLLHFLAIFQAVSRPFIGAFVNLFGFARRESPGGGSESL
jgi:hypothetical protein